MQKTNNLIAFIEDNAHNTLSSELALLKKASAEQIYTWVKCNLIPKKDKVDECVNDFLKSYKLEVDDAAKDKIKRYIMFYIDICA